MQTTLVFLFVGIVSAACNTLSNRMDTVSLNCGDDYRFSRDYFIVLGPDGRRLNRSEFEMVNLSDESERYPGLSSRGCVAQPTQGKYIVRSAQYDWAAIADAKDLQNIQTLSLIDHGDESISISCDEKKARTVSNQFPVDSLIVDNIDPKLRAGYEIRTEVLRNGKILRPDQRFPLVGLDQAKPFDGLAEEGDYGLNVSIRNRVKGRLYGTKKCLFKLDHTPPEVELAINAQNDFTKIYLKSAAEIGIADIGAELGFSSNADDIQSISFCAKRLDDDFDEKMDLDKKKAWKLDSERLDCEGLRRENAGLNEPILTDRTSGFWSIRYQATDRLGNISAPKSATILRFHRQDIELAKSTASGEVLAAILQKRSFDAANSALRAYGMWEKLPTRYEKNLAFVDIFVALNKVHSLRALSMPLRGHTETPTGLVFANQDKRVITASSDKTVRFWDATSGTLLKSILEEFDYVNGLDLDASGRFMYANFPYFKSKIWDLDSDSVIRTFAPKNFQSTSSAISPDAQMVAYADVEGNVNVWHLPGEQGKTFGKVPYLSRSLQFSPDNTQLVASSESFDIQIWDVAKGLSAKTLKGHTESTVQIKFSHDGTKLYSASSSGAIKIWDVGSQLELAEFGVGSTPASLHSSTDDKTLLVATEAGSLVYADISALPDVSLSEISLDSGVIKLLSPNRDLRGFILGSTYPNELTRLGRVVGEFFQGRSFSLDPIPDSDHIQFSLDSKVVRFFGGERISFADTVTKKLLPTEAASGLRFNGNPLIPQIKDLDVEMIDLMTGDVVKTMKNVFANESGGKVLLTRDQNKLLAADGTRLRLYDIHSSAKIGDVDGGEKTFQVIFLSPDGKTFFTGSYSGEILKWDLATLTVAGKLLGHRDRISSLSSNRDGSILLSGSWDKSVRTWSVETMTQIHSLEGSFDWVTGVSFSPNEKLILSAGRDNLLHVWDSERGREVHSMKFRPASLMKFSPNGKSLAIVFEEGGGQVVDFDMETFVRNICQAIGRMPDSKSCK